MVQHNAVLFSVYHNMFTQYHHSKIFIHKREKGNLCTINCFVY